jgi:3-isopropylmalate/(R)-2-methylmalate dehydratase large subunit
MEGRMTICNMSIEAGARAGLIAPDETTFNYLKGRVHAPQGNDWNTAIEYWKTLKTDAGATYDETVICTSMNWHRKFRGAPTRVRLCPSRRTFLHRPISAMRPSRRTLRRLWSTWGWKAVQRSKALSLDRVFIGSCTNGRIEDLRLAAHLVEGKKRAEHVNVMVVPGSGQVKLQAEAEGLHEVFKSAGFEWREPGLLDVSRHEPRYSGTRRALRKHQQPQL